MTSEGIKDAQSAASRVDPDVTQAVSWTVYMIRCSDESIYTGVTTDLNRRFAEHSGNSRGARYFNGRTPESVVFAENGHDRSSALIREAAIKKLSRQEKLRLIAAHPAQEQIV